MLAQLSWRERKAIEESERFLGDSRYVDFGVRIHVVRQDLKRGAEVIPGKAPVVSLRIHDIGGVMDTRLREFVGPSEKPIIWYCSEGAEPLVLHDCAEPNLLVYGSMGAGKTTGVLAPWVLLRMIELTGFEAEIGTTAPTEKRLGELEKAIKWLAPLEWYGYRVKDKQFTFHNGVECRMVSTTIRSASEGSPIQGWNWAACASDEIQDSLAVDSDIEARGRAAPTPPGYRRCCTATAKDSASWRSKRDEWLTSGYWRKAHLDGWSNPFVYASYWDRLKSQMSDRDYRRKVLAQDVGPERAVYTSWNRSVNVTPRPMIGAKDVTARVLSGFHALVGHDPGALFDVSLVLKCFEISGKLCWFVIDELTTESTTTEEHARALSERLQTVWGLQLPGNDEPKVLVRCDPYGESDASTDRSVYLQFKMAGFRIMSAAYNKQGQGKGKIHKEAGIGMVNMLLRSASGESRLFIDCDDRRQPCAPKLVEALEMSARDESGKAEQQKKDKRDLSHWPAALRYALWPYERMRDGDGVRLGEGMI